MRASRKTRVGLAATLLLGLVAAGAGMLPDPAPATPSSKREVETPRAPQGKHRPHADGFGDPLPPGAVARVGTIRWWSGPVSGHCPLAYTPDGKCLVSCDDDKAIRFLDAETGKELRRIEPPGHGVFSFALSPDGKTLVTGTARGGGLWLWDAATGKELRRLTEESGTVAIAFSRDGKRFATLAERTGIRLWDTPTWKETRRLPGKEAGLNEFLAFLPDGKTLITGDRQVIRWWDIGTGQVVRRLEKGLNRGFYELAVSPDGKRLAVVVQGNVLYLWDAATGKEVQRTVLPRSQGGWCLCFSPDSRTLACGNGIGRRGSVTVFFAADTGRELRRWDEEVGPTSRMAFSPDGKVLAQTGADVIWLRDTLTGKPFRPVPGAPGSVMAVRFSRDGKALIAVCRGGRSGSWDPLTGKQVAAMQGPPKDFRTLPPAFYRRTALTADGSKAALADARGHLYVWETTTGKLCCRITEPPPCGGDGPVFSADGKVVTLGHSDSSLRLWETMTGKLLRSFPQIKSRFLRPLAFSPDGRTLALYFLSTTAFTEAKEILLWDTTTGKERNRLPWPEDTSPASVLFTADGKRLIVSYDPQWAEGEARDRIGLCVWDLTSGRELRRCRGVAGAIALSPDEKMLAAADGKTVRLWELASGKERGRFTGHRKRILSLAFSPDGRLLASGGQDHTVLVWDVTGLSPDGKWSSREAPPGEIECLWADLGSTNGSRAYRAVWALASVRQATPFLARRLRPVPRVEEERLRRLLADLDSARFGVRRRASRELEQLGDLAEPALRQALAGKPSAEVRRQLQSLLDQVGSRPLSDEQLQALRVLEVLEKMGTPAAHQVLTRLTTGAPGAFLTREAKAALDRLASRPSSHSE